MTSFLPPVVAELTSNVLGFVTGIDKAKAETTSLETRLAVLERPVVIPAPILEGGVSSTLAAVSGGDAALVDADKIAAANTVIGDSADLNVRKARLAYAEAQQSVDSLAAQTDVDALTVEKANVRMADAAMKLQAAQNARAGVTAATGALTQDTSAATANAAAHDKAAKATEGHGGALGGLTGPMMLGGAAVAGIGLESLKAAGDLQELTTQLVTGADESASQLDMVRQGLMAMAPAVGITADELAKGMYNVESAGYHGAQGLAVLKAAAEGAAVGGADMATVADGLTTAMNSYSHSGLTATQMTNDLIATVAAGKMHMEDLAGSLGHVLPAASAAGVSLQQVTAAMATMTAEGTPAADAATYLRQTILQLSNPTAKAKTEMTDLGLSSIDVSEHLGQRGLTGTLQILTDAIKSKLGPAGTVLIETLKDGANSQADWQAALAKMTPTQQTYVASLADMVGGTKSMQAALELTGSNMQTFQSNLDSISGSVAKGKDEVNGFSEVQGDFNFKLNSAKAALENMAISLGDRLLPVAGRVADLFVNQGIPAMQQFGGWVGDNVVPAVENLADAAATHLLPPLEQLGGWVEGSLVPSLAHLWTSLSTNVLPVVMQVAGVIVTNFLPPLMAVGEFITGTLIGALTWASDHFDALKVPLLAVVAGFVAFKTAMLVGAVIEGVTAGIGILESVLWSSTAAEAAAAAGMEGLGIAIDFALGPIGLIVAAVALAAVGAYELVTHWQQVVSFLRGPWGTAISAAVAVVFPFIGIPMLLIGHWQQVLGFFKGLPGVIGDAFGELGNIVGDVGSFFEGIGDDITHFFEDLPDRILGALGSIGSTLLNAGKSLLIGFYTGVWQKWPDILAWFITLPVRILATTVQANVWLIETGGKLIIGLVTGIIGAVPSIVEFFGVTLPTTIWGLVIAADTWLTETGVKLLRGLFNGVVSGAQALWGFWTSMPGRVLGFFTSADTWLLQKGTDLVYGLYKGLLGFWQTVVGWFKDIPGMILGAIGDLGGLLWDVGKSLIQGFIGGIKSMFTDVKNTLGDLAGSLVSWKGPPSTDAILLTDNGRLVIDGFIRGLEERYPDVQRSLGGLTLSLPNAVGGGAVSASTMPVVAAAGASIGAGLGSAQGGGGVSITIQTMHVNGQNAQELSQDFLRQIRDGLNLNARQQGLRTLWGSNA